ncbi:hypothetical protein LUU34_00352300 [Aix galericulata]|nr:hypothetical protein LUU34_00352300 [Aix galericulata]
MFVFSHQAIPSAVDRACLERAREDFDPKQLLQRKQKQFSCDQWHFPGFLLALPKAECAVEPAGNEELVVSLGLVSLLPDSPNQLLLPKSLATSFTQ